MAGQAIVETLAWRQLRHCRNYFPGPVDPRARDRLRAGEAEDAVIGMYANAPDEVIVVGEKGIYLRGPDGKLTAVAHSEIVDVRGPQAPGASSEIRLGLRDGREVKLAIRGMEGDEEDVWPFLRFFLSLVPVNTHVAGGDHDDAFAAGL